MSFIQLYGIIQDPNNSNYVIVMNYANDGSLRKYLPNIIIRKYYNWASSVT